MHYSDISALRPHSWVAGATHCGTFGTGSAPPASAYTRNHTTDERLRGRHILVVEDEVTIAFDLEYALMDRGAHVVGPAGNLTDTLDLIGSNHAICAAILDVRLGNEHVYPAAQLLRERGIPFLFHTGHAGEGEVIKHFPDATVCVKPQPMDHILDTLVRFLII